MTISKLSLIFSSALLFSCQNMEFANKENYHLQLEKYVGSTFQTLFDEWGYADSTSDTPTGNKVYVYTKSRIVFDDVDCSTSANGSTSCSGGDSQQKWCKTYFEVDKDSVVVNFSLKGNDCKACTANAAPCLK